MDPQDTTTDYRLSYSMEEVAERLGVSRSFAYDLVRTGALRTFKLGRRRRLVSHEALIDLIRDREADEVVKRSVGAGVGG
jgi:excisionase family DNA binding protein